MSTANTLPPPPAPTHSVVFASKYREFSKYMGLNTTLDSQHFDDTTVYDKKKKKMALGHSSDSAKSYILLMLF